MGTCSFPERLYEEHLRRIPEAELVRCYTSELSSRASPPAAGESRDLICAEPRKSSFDSVRQPASVPALGGDILLVIGGRQQPVRLARVLQLDFEQPRPTSVLVHLLRRGVESFIHFRHSSGGRRKDIRNRLHLSDCAKGLAGGELGSVLRQLDEHD